MNNSKAHETRQPHAQADSHTDKPSYENLEVELINLYPKLDLLNSQIAELQVTISSMCQSCDIKNECNKKEALDEVSEKIQLKNLTRLSVIALETAQIIAALRKDHEKVAILEHAVGSVKIIDAYAQRTE
jgi:predicted phosphohydrolase